MAMSPSFSQTLMDIRAEAGVLDAELLEASEAEGAYLNAAVLRASTLSDEELRQELERLNEVVEARA